MILKEKPIKFNFKSCELITMNNNINSSTNCPLVLLEFEDNSAYIFCLSLFNEQFIPLEIYHRMPDSEDLEESERFMPAKEFHELVWQLVLAQDYETVKKGYPKLNRALFGFMLVDHSNESYTIINCKFYKKMTSSEFENHAIFLKNGNIPIPTTDKFFLLNSDQYRKVVCTEKIMNSAIIISILK